MGLTGREFQQVLANRASANHGRVAGEVNRERAAALKLDTPFDRMNRTEARYSGYLELLRVAGAIRWWGYESIKLRLANRTYYTPDFTVIRADGHIEFHEVKGFLREDANVKFKVAAEQFPFEFLMVRRAGSGWETIKHLNAVLK